MTSTYFASFPTPCMFALVDARGIALSRYIRRAKHEGQREREADLVSAVATLEKEKEVVSRGLVMAEERCGRGLYIIIILIVPGCSM